jgi:putative SOS response-associated peptidase YedK
MCYNVANNKTANEIAERYGAEIITDLYRPSMHFKLSNQLPVIAVQDGSRVLDTRRWGFVPFYNKEAKPKFQPGNAKAETVATTPMFRDAFKTRRALVPVTQFYEWIGEQGNKHLVPFLLNSDEIFSLAAVWDTWRPTDGDPISTVAVLTTEPNEMAAEVHDRMPVIIGRDDEAAWLDHANSYKDLLPLLAPFPVGLMVRSAAVHPNELR